MLLSTNQTTNAKIVSVFRVVYYRFVTRMNREERQEEAGFPGRNPGEPLRFQACSPGSSGPWEGCWIAWVPPPGRTWWLSWSLWLRGQPGWTSPGLSGGVHSDPTVGNQSSDHIPAVQDPVLVLPPLIGEELASGQPLPISEWLQSFCCRHEVGPPKLLEPLFERPVR